MKSNEKLLSDGSFLQLVLKLSLPAIVITLVLVIYNIADIYFIGKTNDPNQIAALSLSTPVFSILSGFGTLFGSGGTILISTALGAGNKNEVKKISSTSFYLSLISGIILTSIVLFLTPTVVNFLGADSATQEYAISYQKIISLGFAIAITNTAFGNIIRADGSAVVSMISNIIGTIANIILDALFVMVLHKGVVGAAFATVIGNLISFLFIVYYIYFKQDSLSISPKHIGYNILKIGAYGLPMALSSLLMSISDTFSNNLMMAYGPNALAAQSCASKTSMIITMTSMGLIMGLQPAYAYSYGAKNLNRLNSIIKKSLVLSVVIGSLLSLICYINKETLISIFIADATIISLGKDMIIASLIVGPFSGIFFTCQSFLQSTGNIKNATLISLLEKFIVFIPVLYISNIIKGMIGIAWTKSLTMFIVMITAIFISIKWNKIIKDGKILAK